MGYHLLKIAVMWAYQNPNLTRFMSLFSSYLFIFLFSEIWCPEGHVSHFLWLLVNKYNDSIWGPNDAVQLKSCGSEDNKDHLSGVQKTILFKGSKHSWKHTLHYFPGPRNLASRRIEYWLTPRIYVDPNQYISRAHSGGEPTELI